MKQNTNEWLELRKTKIGASDAPIILGVSPWKTPLQLWEEKLGLRESEPMNEHMRRGHELEPVARAAYNDATGNLCEPEVVFHPEYEWMMASLDGISPGRDIIVEIKCPGEADHITASEGKVPSKYYPQLQHQMACANVVKAHYFSYRDGNFHLVEVARDEEFINDLLVKEREFFKCMQDFKAPEMHAKDYVERLDEEWHQACETWRERDAQLKEAKLLEAEAKARLIHLSNGISTVGYGVKATKFARKGAVDYGKIPEIEGVDLEQYRKKPTVMWRVTTNL